jgi:hypothetical protein
MGINKAYFPYAEASTMHIRIFAHVLHHRLYSSFFVSITLGVPGHSPRSAGFVHLRSTDATSVFGLVQ